jgi:hypothetical protein
MRLEPRSWSAGASGATNLDPNLCRFRVADCRCTWRRAIQIPARMWKPPLTAVVDVTWRPAIPTFDKLRPLWYSVRKITLLPVVICALAQQPPDPYRDEFLPHAQAEDVKEPRVGAPTVYFRYFSDAEERPSRGAPRLQNFVKNLHRSEGLIFSWPKTNLAAPTHAPLKPGDDKRNARDVPTYRLDADSPITYNQGGSRVQASAYAAQDSASQSVGAGEPARALESEYEEPGFGSGGEPLRLHVKSSYERNDGAINISANLKDSRLKIGFGVFASPSTGEPYFAPYVEQPGKIDAVKISSWIRAEEQVLPLGALRLDYKSDVLITACGGCSISFRSKTAAWDFVSLPMFVQLGEKVVAAGMASIYLPSKPR